MAPSPRHLGLGALYLCWEGEWGWALRSQQLQQTTSTRDGLPQPGATPVVRQNALAEEEHPRTVGGDIQVGAVVQPMGTRPMRV